ncbi:MAG: hypothetical protein J1E83_05355 [Lachnospiraceae bacterium]|nr:hypothetical protein [Lachnospiraceae bacterium]
MRGKKVLVIFLTLLLAFSSSIQMNAKENNRDTEQMALAFYNANMVDIGGIYDAGLSIGRKVEFKNFNNEITAEMYIYYDEQMESHGYVVLDSINKTAPIIEFAYEGQSFIEIFEEQLINKYGSKEVTVQYYYLGGYQYIAEVIGESTTYYNLLNGSVMEDVTAVTMLDEVEFEVSPFQFTSTSSTEVNVPGYDLNYYAAVYFHDAGNCGPTAGVNFCVYYYNQGKTALRYNSWETTYTLLYDYMLTTSNGTYVQFIKNGLISYVSDQGYSCSGGLTEVDGMVEMARLEIDAGRPVILGLNGDATYGNHAVVALGYQILSGVTYFRIADGWGSTADRYIHNTNKSIVACVNLTIK